MKTTLFLDYPTILVNQSRPVHCAIQFQAEKFLNPRLQPAAFCIVLDRSGSMAGKPLNQAKEAAKLAVRNLRTEDEFALVTFDSEARTVVPLQQVKNKAEICAAIDRIQDGGSTNLTAGWMLGKDELAKSNPDAARRLLLLSDGQLNHGIVDPTAVRQIVISGLEHERLRTSCLGFGEGYNEDLMAELASATNGQFYDAQSPEKLPAIFASELDGLQRICVQNLRIRVKRDTFCEQFALLGEYGTLALPDGRMEFAVGDLVSEEERIVCFEVKVLALPLINGQPAFKLEGEPLIHVEIVWDEITEKAILSKTLLQTVVIQATQNPAEVLVNSVVAPWVSLQKAGAVAVEVNKQMDAGNPSAAVALIESVIQHLQAYGTGADEAIKVLAGIKDKIVNYGWDELARKQSRYSSSSYRKMSSKEMWSGADDQLPSFKKAESMRHMEQERQEIAAREAREAATKAAAEADAKRQRAELQKAASHSNSIMILMPYKHLGSWVFDDAAVGLCKEPFVAGIDTMIDQLVKDIPDADNGFKLTFSATAFPGYNIKLEWRRPESGGNWYYSPDLKTEGWLCPALYKYFEQAPKELYGRVEARKKQ